MRASKHFMNKKIEEKVHEVFINSIKNAKSHDEVISFLKDLLSPAERSMLAKRVSIAFILLENKYSYEDIIKTLKVSDGTVAKVHAVLALQGSGYRKTIGDIFVRKIIRNSLAEFLDILTSLPPKGANIGEWKKSKRLSRNEREKPL